MEAVIYVGLPGAGKSSWYAAQHLHSHVRISLDQLRDRRREAVLLHACLSVGLPLVIDNTNPTRAARARYVRAARAEGYRIEAIVFELSVDEALARNQRRSGRARVPDVAIRGIAAKLEPVQLEEGFDRVVWLRLGEDGGPVVHRELLAEDPGGEAPGSG